MCLVYNFLFVAHNHQSTVHDVIPACSTSDAAAGLCGPESPTSDEAVRK